jgi:hypothetical protein
MSAELLDQPKPVHCFMPGMMEDMQFYKAEEKVTR